MPKSKKHSSSPTNHDTFSRHQMTQPTGRHSILDSDIDVVYEASSPTKRNGTAETRVEKKFGYACRNTARAKLIMIVCTVIFIIAACCAMPFIVRHLHSSIAAKNPITLNKELSDESDEESSASLETTSSLHEDINTTNISHRFTQSKGQSFVNNRSRRKRKIDQNSCISLRVNPSHDGGGNYRNNQSCRMTQFQPCICKISVQHAPSEMFTDKVDFGQVNFNEAFEKQFLALLNNNRGRCNYIDLHSIQRV